MKEKFIWLIYHKASMSPTTPMNMDGSEFSVGIGVVPAFDMPEAIALFKDYLRSNHMELLDLWKCVRHGADEYGLDNESEESIESSVLKAKEQNKIFYTCGISSEVLSNIV